MSFRVLPESDTRGDWPRLVAQTTNRVAKDVAGLLAPFARRTVTATGDLLVTDSLVLGDATAGAITLTLPAVASSDGARIIVKKIDASANAVTVDGNGVETIDGAANQALAAQYDAITVWCDGATWHIV